MNERYWLSINSLTADENGHVCSRTVLHHPMHRLICESRPAYGVVRHPATRGPYIIVSLHFTFCTVLYDYRLGLSVICGGYNCDSTSVHSDVTHQCQLVL